MNSPLVSVIVTTRNNADTIGACLLSIKNQTYNAIELLVIDNDSSDDTQAIAKNYTKQVYIKGPERSAQRNFGVSKCSGEYVLIIDSDMELSEDVVAECVAAITSAAQAVIIPEESFGVGFWAQCKALERSFYNGVDWIEAPRFFSRELYLGVGGYDEELVGSEDWDLASRIRLKSNITRTTAIIRHNEGELTFGEIIHSRKTYARGFRDRYKKVNPASKYVQAFKTFGLFFSRPVKLFKNPVKGFAVLLMKSAEYATLAVGK